MFRASRQRARLVSSTTPSPRRLDKGVPHGCVQCSAHRGRCGVDIRHRTRADGVNIDTLGIILMVVGAIGLVASVLRGSMLGIRSTRERRVSDDGRTVVERERTGGI